ncbi:hypothetical protein BDQ17DRAFT_1382036 [Cyathus striatus]|nr:hypothetical protein BDQ17DRAFT_1382036 [Cyathus striatus]
MLLLVLGMYAVAKLCKVEALLMLRFLGLKIGLTSWESLLGVKEAIRVWFVVVVNLYYMLAMIKSKNCRTR